jgi:hypothetical protein
MVQPTVFSFLAAALAATSLVSGANSHPATKRQREASAPKAERSPWALETSVQGQDLLNFFHFETEDSSSQGGVAQYVSLDDAHSNSMAGIKNNVTYLGVDTVAHSGSTRNSIRLSSKTLYNAGTMFVIDILHMPTGCGTWPSIWTVARDGDWPEKGELDIVEGVNNFLTNSMSAHTKSGFELGESGFSAEFMLYDSDKNYCDACATDDQGCGLMDPDQTTFGSVFNDHHGGVFVMVWTDAEVSMYMFNRTALPSDLAGGAPAPSTDTWGEPRALFKGVSGQNTTDFFQDHVLVINTNLCGSWPEGVWSSDASYAGQAESCATSTRKSTCAAYIESAGEELANAYWAINKIEVYS